MPFSRRSKRLRIATGLVVGALMVASQVAVTNLRVVAYFLAPDDHLRKADAILVFSGDPGYERTLEAARLYHLGYARYLVFSGRGSPGDSAESMAHVARMDGVPDDAILLDGRATNTYENVLFVREVIAQHDIRQLILVTSPYHQRRASLVARRLLPRITLINHPIQGSLRNAEGWWQYPAARAAVLLEYEKLVRYYALGHI